MNESLKEMLNHLPSGENFKRNMSLDEGHRLGVAFSGDLHDGKEVYKFLSSEGVMYTYLLDGRNLEFWYSQKLHA